jgi:citryl-CoA lyase
VEDHVSTSAKLNEATVLYDIKGSTMSAQSTPSFWTTTVSDIMPEDVYIRGYPLRSILGRLSFSAVSYLIIRGAMPTPGQARMMETVLCAILDYSLQKSGTVAARFVVSVNPQMTAGLAAGVLAAGEHAMSPEHTGRFMIDNYRRWKESGESVDTFAGKFVAELRRTKARVPGFGHQVFRGVDPRAERIKEVAQEVGVWGPYGEWYEAVHRAFKAAAAKPDLVINDMGMLACVLAEMGFTPQEMVGLSILSTFPGLIAHVSEEISSGVRNRIVPDSIASIPRNRRDLEEDLKSAGWS